jgi:hypothetical protein
VIINPDSREWAARLRKINISMILSEQEIREIIVSNPNKELVQKGRDYNARLCTHFYGTGLDKYKAMDTVEGFEKPSLHALRVKYASSNKDLFARVSRPVDKVFSAKGGSTYYNLPDTQEKRARQLASDIKSGYSIKSWVENFWKPHFQDDPYGILFMEITAPVQKAILLKQQGKSFVYPTYRSITTIYDYQPNGAAFEYVVFELTREEKSEYGVKPEDRYFRVVDDAADYIVKREDETVIIDQTRTLKNFFGYVPAIRNSDIPDPNTENGVLSYFDEVLELADRFLLKGSIKVTHEFLHGFPKYWEYADDCLMCGGTGHVAAGTCPDCKGSGKSIMTKVSDAKLLNYPQTKEDAIVTPNVAGYVSPDKTYWEISTQDLQLLEDLMNFTLWGSNPMPKTQGMQTSADGKTQTATEILSDVKPQSDRLHPISESAAKRDKFILDGAVRIQIQPSYPGSSVNYGKRYMLESPDVLWEKYQDARTKGGAASVLDDLLMEYYEAKYDSDPVKLAIQSKLMKVEPFIHFTPQQVQLLKPAEEDYKAKLYFSEWLSTVNEAMLLSFSVEELRANLVETVKVKQLPQPEEKKPIAA